jgi:hypothetical protein
MTYLVFLAAFLLSGISAYYSVIGLAAIFSGAFWPVVFMGSALEFSKLVTASWLYRNWKIVPLLLRTYLTIAVVILMLITSMGIFGFLAKSHIDSTLDAGANTVELKTLNQQQKIAEERLNYLLARAKDPSTASNRLDSQIQTTQKELTDINKKRLPLLKESNKLVADVGPIKYVADIFFGNGDGALDQAVRLVIFAIMLVFDPLAVLLLIAGNISLKPKEEVVGPTDEEIEETKEWFEKIKLKVKKLDEDKVEIEKENIASIEENVEQEFEKVIVTTGPGRHEERIMPRKKLEPKYDYESELAFREKENK